MNPLFAVRDRLRQRGLATVGQLASEENLAPAVVEEMLEHWQRRGYVEPLALNGAACGTGGGGCASSCGSCPTASLTPAKVYRWCGPQAKEAVVAQSCVFKISDSASTV